jgi:hypothetical protein
MAGHPKYEQERQIINLVFAALKGINPMANGIFLNFGLKLKRRVNEIPVSDYIADSGDDSFMQAAIKIYL